jgi:hypothetical protein
VLKASFRVGADRADVGCAVLIVGRGFEDLLHEVDADVYRGCRGKSSDRRFLEYRAHLPAVQIGRGVEANYSRLMAAMGWSASGKTGLASLLVSSYSLTSSLLRLVSRDRVSFSGYTRVILEVSSESWE